MEAEKNKAILEVLRDLRSKFSCTCNLQEQLKEDFNINLNRKMRITVISDTHQLHNRVVKTHGTLPGGDLLIHAGDFMNSGTSMVELNNFCEWFDSLDQYTHKIFIAGNHDVALEEQKEDSIALINQFDNIRYVEDETIEIEHNGKNIKIYGSPWQPEFYDWAFNLPRSGSELEEKWKAIPEDTDILITHTPPQDHLDVSGPPYNQPHLGCELLRVRLDELKPKINVFGHIHGSYGYKFDGNTHFMNASCLNERYVAANSPITFDWNYETNEIFFIN